MNTKAASNTELFKLNGTPTFRQAFPQAMQHVLAMLIGNITPPMLIASTLSLPAEEQIMLTRSFSCIRSLDSAWGSQASWAWHSLTCRF